jgi:hypothetical protein
MCLYAMNMNMYTYTKLYIMDKIYSFYEYINDINKYTYISYLHRYIISWVYTSSIPIIQIHKWLCLYKIKYDTST